MLPLCSALLKVRNYYSNRRDWWVVGTSVPTIKLPNIIRVSTLKLLLNPK